MKILISGASGFIGSNLRVYLQEHLQDISFIHLVRSLKGDADEITWDELSNGIPADIDAIIHLAGLAHDTKKTQNDDAYFTVNYELTKKLYDLYLQSNATRFIYTSSVKAAADEVEGVLTEMLTPSPVTAYGKSKLKSEEYIAQHAAAGKSYYILRPCMVHGPGNKGNLNLLYKFVEKGLPYPLGAFDNVRSFLAVENFCYVCSLLLTKDVEQGVYNVADDEPLSTNDLVTIIAAAIGKKPRINKIPKGLVGSLAKLGDVLKLPVNSERLQKLTENYVVSNERLKWALGIKHLPVNVRDGVMSTIKSFKQ